MKEDNPKTRVSLDVSPSLNKRLETLERLTQADSKASVIRHAIQVYEYIVNKTSEGYTFKGVIRRRRRGNPGIYQPIRIRPSRRRIMQEITLANLATKTEQEVFNYIALHLITQNKRAEHLKSSQDEGAPLCAYLGGDGLRCAGGCLIDPSEYRPEFEGKVWRTLVDTYSIPSAHMGLISSMQSVHDSDQVLKWKSNLVELAKSRHLDIPDFLLE